MPDQKQKLRAARARAYKAEKVAIISTALCVLFAALFIVAVSMLLFSKPAAAEVPALEIAPAPVVEPEELPENERIEAALLERAHRIDNVTVTHYCICEKCCGKAPDHPAYGITASGRKATPGTSVAVDPDLIPLGSTVMVDYGDGELVYYNADDTGSAIKGAHIDVCMDSHEAALQAGVKTATVYWVEE